MVNTFRTEQARRTFNSLMEAIPAIFAWALSMIALIEPPGHETSIPIRN